jgi:hypothetical protein
VKVEFCEVISIEGLGSDIEDFKVLKLPEQGIVVIESVVSDARKKGKK